MPTQHKNIVEADLHEPKGASTASSGKVYVANGAGSGTWALADPKGSNTATVGQVYVSDGAGNGVWKMAPFGFIYFTNIAAPYTLAYPATLTKLAPTTTASTLGNLITEGTNARLTYLGPGEIMDVVCAMSVDQAIGANRDLRFSIHKNGAATAIAGSTMITTTTTAEKQFLSISAVVSMATNDYIEVFAQNDGVSGDIRVYTFSFSIDPH